MKRAYLTYLAWGFAGVILFLCIFLFTRDLLARGGDAGPLRLVSNLLWMIYPIFFAIPGALIVSRQPRNMIGWLLMIPAAAAVIPALGSSVINVPSPPARASLLFMFLLWYDNWSWVPFIFPILLIPLLFPTGRPPSPRWRWVVYYACAMAVIFPLMVTFSARLSPLNYPVGWEVKNPIGFITDDLFSSPFITIPWIGSLTMVTVISVAALVVRFRRAPAVERAQIKWLLYASAMFAVAYFGVGLIDEKTSVTLSVVLNIFFNFALLTLPLAIAASILRYHLFDIDLIIRKTLLYALLTGFLGLTYFGSIVILQTIFQMLLGLQSPAAIVISTLGIAAIFTPLRSLLQAFIDRRFYRQKYDAEKLLADFTRKARDETDLDALTGDLLGAVRDTLQPEAVSLWIKANK